MGVSFYALPWIVPELIADMAISYTCFIRMAGYDSAPDPCEWVR